MCKIFERQLKKIKKKNRKKKYKGKNGTKNIYTNEMKTYRRRENITLDVNEKKNEIQLTSKTKFFFPQPFIFLS